MVRQFSTGMKSGEKNELGFWISARIPPQTPPAGGKRAEAGRIHSPRQIVSPCRVRISSFNHLDFARNSFELCPTNTAVLSAEKDCGGAPCRGAGRERFEDLASILWSEANRKSARCTETVSFDSRVPKIEKAREAELLYAHDLKSCLERDVGSIPAPGT